MIPNVCYKNTVNMVRASGPAFTCFDADAICVEEGIAIRCSAYKLSFVSHDPIFLAAVKLLHARAATSRSSPG